MGDGRTDHVIHGAAGMEAFRIGYIGIAVFVEFMLAQMQSMMAVLQEYHPEAYELVASMEANIAGRIQDIAELARANFACFGLDTSIEMPISARGLLDKVLLAAMESCSFDGITVIKRCTDAPLNMFGNDVLLQMILLNFLKNSVEAIHESGEKGTITIETSFVHGDTVQISVQDTGGGISCDPVHQIFSPGFTTKEGRSGIGLPIVLFLTYLHHGTIFFQSNHEGGCVFNIWIPGEIADNVAESS